MSWTKTLAKGLNRVEHGIDRMRFAFMETFGVRKPLIVNPYIGHSNGEAIFLRGRVLLENRLQEAKEDDTAWRNLLNMYYRFESDEIPYATVRASFGGVSEVVTCDEEGYFELELRPKGGVPRAMYWQHISIQVINTPVSSIDTSDTITLAPVIVPAQDAQFGVISDLDDTIMKTDAINLFKMLRNTILRNAHTRLPFDGVAAFYRALHEGLHNRGENPIFYVSSSPWNLYDMIIEFYQIKGIPIGPVFLRDIGLAANALGGKSHMGHKLAHIEALLTQHSSLPFILIGDSGQKDVWVYQEVVRRYPNRIAAVYIRNITQNEDRRAQIAEVQKSIGEMGSEMLLVADTHAAAKHAAAHGYIAAASLPGIEAACRHDEPVQ